MTRPTRDQYMMQLAQVAAGRSTCCRRAVGCVLTNSHGHVLAIGYNGVAAGLPHCEGENKCTGHDLAPGLDNCEAVHAEQNALIQCRDPQAIDTAYVTLSPCKACLKLLMNTSCRRIVFASEWEDPWSKAQWLKLGREWSKL